MPGWTEAPPALTEENVGTAWWAVDRDNRDSPVNRVVVQIFRMGDAIEMWTSDRRIRFPEDFLYWTEPVWQPPEAYWKPELARNVPVTHTASPVHNAFGLSYSNYAVYPRCLLQEMDTDWQDRFVKLMDIFSKAFPGFGEVVYTVLRNHPKYTGWSPAALEEERERRAFPVCPICGDLEEDDCECGEGFEPEDPDWQVPTIPDPLANYRHPDYDEIGRVCKPKPTVGELAHLLQGGFLCDSCHDFLVGDEGTTCSRCNPKKEDREP
jgi:hypothetical protein